MDSTSAEDAMVIDDSVLGRLTWNPELDWYEGEVAVGEGRLGLYLSFDATDDALLAEARRLHPDLPTLVDAAARFAGRRLLAKRNADFCGEGERELTLDEFCARLRAESVTILEEGSTEIHFGDGDLFAGRPVLVAIDPEGRFEDASLGGSP